MQTPSKVDGCTGWAFWSPDNYQRMDDQKLSEKVANFVNVYSISLHENQFDFIDKCHEMDQVWNKE